MDPEARATLDQLLYFVSELLDGNPLPPYKLTEEAVAKRAERVQANMIREQKRGKKAQPPAPEKKDIPVGVSQSRRCRCLLV